MIQRQPSFGRARAIGQASSPTLSNDSFASLLFKLAFLAVFFLGIIRFRIDSSLRSFCSVWYTMIPMDLWLVCPLDALTPPR
ncbi:hypothetical protein BO71DRAFT_189471 [Aspergillus ellipticus CBS 707.79]|uniref:Uncharacterized protein n=1 Tax=Aspergillus ellipticus CBS 707.79 TaxID=1448320 RepID=A0A319E5S2_9EURO|nr:hypothetical protein BO71DRAFT_189471 [Aspergillus ellipticus CBS 707.79]